MKKKSARLVADSMSFRDKKCKLTDLWWRTSRQTSMGQRQQRHMRKCQHCYFDDGTGLFALCHVVVVSQLVLSEPVGPWLLSFVYSVIGNLMSWLMRYLHLQAQPVMQRFSAAMLAGGNYNLHPGQDVPMHA
jgi:hypothetical protein